MFESARLYRDTLCVLELVGLVKGNMIFTIDSDEEIEDEIQAIKAEQQSRDAAQSEDARQEASRNAMYSDKVTFSGALPCAVQWLLCSTCGLLLQPSATTCLY